MDESQRKYLRFPLGAERAMILISHLQYQPNENQNKQKQLNNK